MSYPKPLDSRGRAWQSLGDLAIGMHLRARNMVWSYDQLLQGDDGTCRRPDAFFPCACGRDGIALEYLGGLDSIPGYRDKWLATRKPWYFAMRHRYLLYEQEPPLNLASLDSDLMEIEDLLANGGRKLHAMLGKAAVEPGWSAAV